VLEGDDQRTLSPLYYDCYRLWHNMLTVGHAYVEMFVSKFPVA